MASSDIEYRGYLLVLGEHPPRMQVHIYPTKSNMPQLPPGSDFAARSTKEAAIAEAKRLVDELLAE